MQKFIDLRSDTVTLPTAAMRQAMAAAEVGDDVYGEDPTIRRLEEMAAARLGKEAALFVPTGTMGNQIAVNLHTRQGQEVVLEARSHIFNSELAAMATWSGVLPRPVEGRRGVLTSEQVADALRSGSLVADTGLIALENSHNFGGGTVQPPEKTAAVLELAQQRGLPTHLDGARIFNAAVAAGVGPEKLAAGFTSVMFCLSKGLGAPVGSVLASGSAFILEARKVRKRMGGGMRQAGIIAAAGVHALDHHVERLAEDHNRARRLAEGMAGLDGLSIDPSDVDTNILVIRVDLPGGPEAFSRKLKESGVLCSPLNSREVRMLTHLDISDGDIKTALTAIRKATSCS